jgi:hypothetical protein
MCMKQNREEVKRREGMKLGLVLSEVTHELLDDEQGELNIVLLQLLPAVHGKDLLAVTVK